MQIAFVLYPGITAMDVVGPYEALRFLPKVELRFVGTRRGLVVTDSAVLALNVTHTYEQTPSPDIVVVPGSSSDTVTAIADGGLISWLQRVHATARWTTSVCSGALILAAAGLLRGTPATTHWIAQPALARLGAHARPAERLVRAGSIVTSAGVSAGIDLGLWLVGEISGREHAEAVQLVIEYDPRPPFDAGHPSKASAPVRELATKLLNG